MTYRQMTGNQGVNQMLTITFTVPDTMTSKVRGKELTVDLTKAVDLNGMAKVLFIYGYNRKWNDAAPMGETLPKDATDDEKAAFYARCYANAVEMTKDWLDGDYEAERKGGGRTADPVAAEAKLHAIAHFERKGGIKYNQKDADHKFKVKELSQHPTIIERAKAAIAARNEDLDIDL